MGVCWQSSNEQVCKILSLAAEQWGCQYSLIISACRLTHCSAPADDQCGGWESPCTFRQQALVTQQLTGQSWTAQYSQFTHHRVSQCRLLANAQCELAWSVSVGTQLFFKAISENPGSYYCSRQRGRQCDTLRFANFLLSRRLWDNGSPHNWLIPPYFVLLLCQG